MNCSGCRNSCLPVSIFSIYMLRGPTIRMASDIAHCTQMQKYEAHCRAKAENFKKVLRRCDDEELQINWMTGGPAPGVFLEFLSCKCKKSCKLPSCQCMVNGLPYALICILHNCENMKEEDVGAVQEVGLVSESDSVTQYTFKASFHMQHYLLIHQ